MLFKVILVVLSCVICFSACYTIHGGHTSDILPSQQPNFSDKKTFLRLDSRHGVEILSCPDKFLFDKIQLKCVFAGEDSKGNGDKFCPENLRGTMAYKNNCRLYVSCWDGRGAIEKCGLNLLYNEDIRHCDYPERANCCEFREKNSSVLI